MEELTGHIVAERVWLRNDNGAAAAADERDGPAEEAPRESARDGRRGRERKREGGAGRRRRSHEGEVRELPHHGRHKHVQKPGTLEGKQERRKRAADNVSNGVTANQRAERKAAARSTRKQPHVHREEEEQPSHTWNICPLPLLGTRRLIRLPEPSRSADWPPAPAKNAAGARTWIT